MTHRRVLRNLPKGLQALNCQTLIGSRSSLNFLVKNKKQKNSVASQTEPQKWWSSPVKIESHYTEVHRMVIKSI